MATWSESGPQECTSLTVPCGQNRVENVQMTTVAAEFWGEKAPQGWGYVRCMQMHAARSPVCSLRAGPPCQGFSATGNGSLGRLPAVEANPFRVRSMKKVAVGGGHPSCRFSTVQIYARNHYEVHTECPEQGADLSKGPRGSGHWTKANRGEQCRTMPEATVCWTDAGSGFYLHPHAGSYPQIWRSGGWRRCVVPIKSHYRRGSRNGTCVPRKRPSGVSNPLWPIQGKMRRVSEVGVVSASYFPGAVATAGEDARRCTRCGSSAGWMRG